MGDPKIRTFPGWVVSYPGGDLYPTHMEGYCPKIFVKEEDAVDLAFQIGGYVLRAEVRILEEPPKERRRS